MAVRPKPRNTRLLLVVLISVSLTTITLDYRQGQSGPLAALGRSAVSLMAPLQRAVTKVTRPVGDFFSNLAHLPSLAEENRRLQGEIQSLKAELALSTTKDLELSRLRSLMQVQQALGPVPSTGAVVVANSPSNFEWTITIDKGSDSGLALDMPVITGTAAGPILVGHIIQVTNNASVVELVLDRDSFVGAKLSASGDTGLVEGQGNADMKMSFIDPTTNAPAGETVVTSGFHDPNGVESIYPPGLVIGAISNSLPASNQLEKTVTVRPAADFSQLDIVLVLLTHRGSVTP